MNSTLDIGDPFFETFDCLVGCWKHALPDVRNEAFAEWAAQEASTAVAYAVFVR